MGKFINNVSVKAKLIGNALILLILVAFSSAYSLYALNQLGEGLHALVEQDLPLTKILTAISIHEYEQAIHFERAIRFSILKKTEKTAEKQKSNLTMK